MSRPPKKARCRPALQRILSQSDLPSPPPILAILIGTGILLVQFVYTFIKISQGENVE